MLLASRRNWDRLTELHSSCDFAERACVLAQALLNGQQVGGDRGSGSTGGNESQVAQDRTDKAIGHNEGDDDDEDDEEALLERSVRVARAREKGAKQSRQRSFGGQKRR